MLISCCSHLANCKAAEAVKTQVFNFQQYWTCESLHGHSQTCRPAVVIQDPHCNTAVQNCSGVAAAELWNIQHPLCISFTTTIVCFAIVTVNENISCMLDYSSCSWTQISIRVGLKSQCNSLGKKIFSSLKICPLHSCLVRRHTDSFEGVVLYLYRSHSRSN